MDIMKTPVKVSSKYILTTLTPLKKNLSQNHFQRQLACQNLKETENDVSQNSVLQYTRQKHSSMYQMDVVRNHPENHFPKLTTSVSLNDVKPPKKYTEKKKEREHIPPVQSASQSTYTKRVVNKNKHLPKYLFINGIQVIEGKIKMDEQKKQLKALPQINDALLRTKGKAEKVEKEEIKEEEEDVEIQETEQLTQEKKRPTYTARNPLTIEKMPYNFSNERKHNSILTQNRSQIHLEKQNVKLQQDNKIFQRKQPPLQMESFKEKVNRMNIQARSYRDKTNQRKKAEWNKKESKLQKNKNASQKPSISFSHTKIELTKRGKQKISKTTPHEDAPSSGQSKSAKVSLRRNPLKYHFDGKRGKSTKSYPSYTDFIESQEVRKELTLKSLEQEWANKSDSSLTSTPWNLANTVVGGLSKLFSGTGHFFSK